MRSVVWYGVAVAAVVACSDAPAAAKRKTIATLAIVAQPAGSLAVTTNVGKFSVRATDSANAPVSGAFVSFVLSRGSGRVTAIADTTDATGIAETNLILGTAPGPHTILASTRGLPPVESGIVTGIPGTTARLNLSVPRLVTIGATQDSGIVSATPQDAQGNTTSSAVTWVSANPARVTVTSSGPGGQNATVRALTRPAETWVFATSAGRADSLLVRVLDAASSPCTFVATPTQLAVGATQSFESTGSVCLSAATPADYLVVAHYNTTVNSVSATVNLLGTGITVPTTAYPALSTAPAVSSVDEPGFEGALRARERAELGSYVDGARAWMRNGVPTLRSALSEGDVTPLNANPSDFCANPTNVPARVAAVTSTAVILTDMENPSGGFTDDEYRSIGATIDTLVHPVDTAAFGAPTDIDGNGRIMVLFTKSVNAITPRGTQGAVLGFFFARDLLPRSSSFGTCPGSNVGELFYIMVPDPTGIVSDPRTKAFVSSIAAATIAHEMQHLINASRRVYVSNAPETNEEIWLNEGLSHIAEELVFYKASKLSPRQNLDSVAIKASGQRAIMDLYQQGNFRRFQQYLRSPDANAPMAENDLLATRGAAWAFLRFAADRTRNSDGDFWRRLVNSRLTGVRNLEDVLTGSGFTTAQLLEEWSRAVVADDIVPGAVAQQPSWSFVTSMPLSGYSFALVPSVLVNGVVFSVPVRGSSSFYGRIAVPAGQPALLQASSPGGGTIPRGMRLTVIRIK